MKAITVVLFLFSFQYQFCFTCSSKIHKSTEIPSKYKRATGSSTVRSASHSTGVHRRRTSRAKRPPCCHFFLWNFPSACRFHLCNYLMRDCVYEGLGGKKVNCISYLGILVCDDHCLKKLLTISPHCVL
jgi:hypothetical protein